MIRVNDPEDSRWAAYEIGLGAEWGPHSCIAWLKDDERQAVVVFNFYCHPDIHMHVAAVDGARWMTPQFLAAAFDYPFRQLGCARVSGIVRADNQRSIAFCERLGFRYEGTKRDACEGGVAMIHFGMLRNECRFLGERYGKRLLCTATA